MVGFDFLAVIPRKGRFGVKRIDVRYATGHEQEDDPLCFGWKMGLFGGILGHQLLEYSRKEHRSSDKRADERTSMLREDG
jgi:hypothetical protein